MILRKYATAGTVDGVKLITRGAGDFKVSPTLAAGDVKIEKDGGTAANLTTLPTVTPASGSSLRVSLSSTELTCARAVVYFVDQTAAKEWEDLVLVIDTYGNASATHGFDLSSASVDVGTINGNASSASNLRRSTLGIVVATVGSASTTTSIVTSSMTPAAAVTDQFKGRIVSFALDTTTVNLRGQSTDITASTSAGALTVTTLTTAPVSGDTFVIT